MNKKFDYNLLKSKVIKEKPVSDNIISHKEKIKELKIKLYKLIGIK